METKLRVGDIVKRCFLGKWEYGIVCTEEYEVASEFHDKAKMAGIAHARHRHLDNLEYVKTWHKVCRYSDNAAVIYDIHPKTVAWFKRCTLWSK